MLVQITLEQTPIFHEKFTLITSEENTRNALFPSAILKRIIFHEGNIIVLKCRVVQIIITNFGS